MRKFSKGMLIAAAVTGIVGIGMSIGGVAMGATITGLNLSKYGFKDAVRTMTKVTWSEDNSDWDQDWDEITLLDAAENEGDTRIYLTDAADDLDFSISAGELFLKEYDGDQIKIEVSGDDKDKIRVGKDEDALILEGIGRVQNRTVNVWYPKNKEFKEVSVEIAAGTVSLENDFCAKKLEVEVAAGEFSSTNTVTANEAEITVGTGNADMQKLDVQKLDAGCGVGNIDLAIAGKKSDYDYEISCAAGSVDVGDDSYSGLGHEKEISNPGSSGKMELECGVGNITVTFEKDS